VRVVRVALDEGVTSPEFDALVRGAEILIRRFLRSLGSEVGSQKDESPFIAVFDLLQDQGRTVRQGRIPSLDEATEPHDSDPLGPEDLILDGRRNDHRGTFPVVGECALVDAELALSILPELEAGEAALQMLLYKIGTEPNYFINNWAPSLFYKGALQFF